MAILESVIGAVVVATFVREVRQTLKPKSTDHSSAWHAAVGWFDLAAGGLLIFEAFHQPHVKPGYMRPPFVSGVVTIALGLFHGRLRAFQLRRRYLKLEAGRVEGRLGPFRRFNFATAELKSVDVSEETVVLQPKDGQPRMIRLGRYGNKSEIREAISSHARATGLLTSGEQKRDLAEATNPGTQPIT